METKKELEQAIQILKKTVKKMDEQLRGIDNNEKFNNQIKKIDDVIKVIEILKEQKKAEVSKWKQN